MTSNNLQINRPILLNGALSTTVTYQANNSSNNNNDIIDFQIDTVNWLL